MHLSASVAARHTPLLAFVAASLALHGALLLGWRPAPLVALSGGDTPSLAVVLQRAAAPASQPATPHKTATTTPPPHEKTVRAATPRAVPEQTPPAAVAPNDTTKPTTTPAATTADAAASDDGAALQQRLLGRIHAELLRSFRYPPLALRNGWQGTVLLGFRINSRGDIEAIHVARSSGYSSLDSAAIGALRKVGRLAVDAAPTTQSFDLQLPVIYRLEES